MEVRRLELIDFRNYYREKVDFGPGLNTVVGGNGQGKTNLLEAVQVACGQGSHRVTGVESLVREGADRAFVRAVGVAGGREIKLESEMRLAEGMRLLVNGVRVERARAVRSAFATILFSPEDLEIVKGGPEVRRRFLDRAAMQLRPLAETERQEFARVLRQRNGVLRAAQVNPRALRTLEVWDEQFVRTAVGVVRNRLGVLAGLEAVVRKRYEEIAGEGGSSRLTYRAGWFEGPVPEDERGIEKALRTALGASRTRDRERGVTEVGPHRDDLALDLGGRDARTYASQGEQRTLALALRVAERDLVGDQRREEPVLLLDDVFSELDDERRSHLTRLVEEGGQTIATATSLAGIPLAGGRRFEVVGGGVRRCA